MKKTIFSILILILSLGLKSQVTFERTYGGWYHDKAYSVKQTSDGGYIIAGSTVSFGAGSSDVYLIKTDETGDTVWTRTYGGSSMDVAYSVLQTEEGGYLIVGNTSSNGAELADIYVIKTYPNGDTTWTRTYGGSRLDNALSSLQTTDGSYIIAGYIGNEVSSFNVYLLKINLSGDTIWTKTFGGNDSDMAISIQQTTDDGYIIAGWTNSYGSGEIDVYLIKTNAQGELLWAKTFGGIEDDIACSVIQTFDGGYILAGWTNSLGAGDSDVYLIKTDSFGDTIWTKTIGGSERDMAQSVKQTSDSGYIIAAWTKSFGAGDSDVYLIKINTSGNIIWTETFGGADHDNANSLQITSDEGYIIAGETDSFNPGDSNDFYLIKTDNSGQITSINNPAVTEQLNLYPNPTTGIINIDFENNETHKITISDITGKTIIERIEMNQNSTFDLSSFENGIYLISIQTDNDRYISKIIKR